MSRERKAILHHLDNASLFLEMMRRALLANDHEQALICRASATNALARATELVTRKGV